MTVGQLLSTISCSEITEWIALYSLEADEYKEAELQAKAVQKLNRGGHRRGY